MSLSTSEPSFEPTSEPEKGGKETHKPHIHPEPLPEWNIALPAWNPWWDIHNFGFASVYVIFAIFSIICIIRIQNIAKSLTLGRYFTCVCGLLLVFTLTRALFLLLDPYEAHDRLELPVVAVRLLFAIGYPCLTSIFSLINFAFIKVNSMWLIARRLQNVPFLAAVITSHFLLVLTVYLVIYSTMFAQLFILCQAVLVVWWLVLVVLFIYCAWKVRYREKIKNICNKKKGDNFTVESEIHDIKGSIPFQTQDNADTNRQGTARIISISGFVVIAGLASVSLELYSLFGVYKLYDLPGGFVSAWPWWGFQTGSRLVEVILCCVVVYVVYPVMTVQTRRRSESGISYRTSGVTMVESFRSAKYSTSKRQDEKQESHV